MIVRTSPQAELGEFYPPPYGSLSPWRPLGGYRGMGQSPAQDIGAAASVAAVIPGGQLVGAALGLAATLTGLLTSVFSGCGQSCTLTSEAANKIEDLLRQNELAYLAIPPNQRYQSVQAAYLANFDNTWAQLVKYCGDPSFGSAGKRCVTDRERGSCKYKDSSGACWNWFVGYRDPIANDPNVIPDPTPAASLVSAFAGSAPGSSAPSGSTGMDLSGLLLPGLLLAVGAAFVFSGGRG